MSSIFSVLFCCTLAHSGCTFALHFHCRFAHPLYTLLYICTSPLPYFSCIYCNTILLLYICTPVVHFLYAFAHPLYISVIHLHIFILLGIYQLYLLYFSVYIAHSCYAFAPLHSVLCTSVVCTVYILVYILHCSQHLFIHPSIL